MYGKVTNRLDFFKEENAEIQVNRARNKIMFLNFLVDFWWFVGTYVFKKEAWT